jgi:hypothetical protein
MNAHPLPTPDKAPGSRMGLEVATRGGVTAILLVRAPPAR